MFNKLKRLAIALLVVAVGIVVLQNTESVETRIFFITIEMPRAVLLASTALIGFVGGLAFSVRVLAGSNSK